MPPLFTKLFCKRFWYNHGFQPVFWRSFCILCSSLYFAVHCFWIFSLNLCNIFCLRLLFSLNPGYSPTLFIIPDLLPRATSRTASDLAFCTNRGRRQCYALPFRNKHPSLAILILLCQSMSVYLKSPMNSVLALFHNPFLSGLLPDVPSYPALKAYSSFLWFYVTHFYFFLKSKWTWLRKSMGGCNSWFRHLCSPSIISSSSRISY